MAAVVLGTFSSCYLTFDTRTDMRSDSNPAKYSELNVYMEPLGNQSGYINLAVLTTSLAGVTQGPCSIQILQGGSYTPPGSNPPLVVATITASYLVFDTRTDMRSDANPALRTAISVYLEPLGNQSGHLTLDVATSTLTGITGNSPVTIVITQP